jgi:hypothetical protein
MAFVHLRLDGENWKPRSQQREDNLHATRGKDFILHCLFVDDMMHTSTNARLKEEFMKKYPKDFNITGGDLIKTSWVCRLSRETRRSSYISIDYITMSLCPKRVPMNPGVPDPHKQKFYHSFVAKLHVDSLRYCIPCIAACPVLCFGRHPAIVSASSSHGVS